MRERMRKLTAAILMLVMVSVMFTAVTAVISQTMQHRKVQVSM